jgi:hypothetical protein
MKRLIILAIAATVVTGCSKIVDDLFGPKPACRHCCGGKRDTVAVRPDTITVVRACP